MLLTDEKHDYDCHVAFGCHAFLFAHFELQTHLSRHLTNLRVQIQPITYIQINMLDYERDLFTIVISLALVATITSTGTR